VFNTECQAPVGSIFVGCLNGVACGTFETLYTFTAKYVDETFAEEIHGRCEHRIVGGTEDFAEACCS
jgi:hypothetical protein